MILIQPLLVNHFLLHEEDRKPGGACSYLTLQLYNEAFHVHVGIQSDDYSLILT